MSPLREGMHTSSPKHRVQAYDHLRHKKGLCIEWANKLSTWSWLSVQWGLGFPLSECLATLVFIGASISHPDEPLGASWTWQYPHHYAPLIRWNVCMRTQGECYLNACNLHVTSFWPRTSQSRQNYLRTHLATAFYFKVDNRCFLPLCWIYLITSISAAK